MRDALNRIRDRGRRPTTRDEAVLSSIACALLHFVDGLTLEEVARPNGTSSHEKGIL